MKTFKQAGFVSVEIIFALMILIGSMSLGMTWLQTDSDSKVERATAEQMNILSDAATKWIKDNYSTVVAAAAPLVTYTPASFGAYVPSTFTTTNPYGQSYSIRVYQPSANKLETLIITTGGETIPDMSLRRIAQLIGGAGGYVQSTDTTKAQGSYGGWNMLFTNYGATPGAGKVAKALFFQDGSLVSDFIYRNSVPGHPELNTMTTPLIMASTQTSGAACTTTAAIAADSTGAIVSCQGGVWKTQSSAGYWKDPVASFAALPGSGNATGDVRETKDTKRAFTWNGSSWIALALDQNGTLNTTGSEGPYGNLTIKGNGNGAWNGIQFKDNAGTSNGTLMMSPSYSGFYNDANATWRWYVTSGGTSYQAGTAEVGYLQVDNTVTEGAACSPNGLVAKDSTGLLLSCQSGIWKRQPGTICGSGQAYIGGSCQAVNAYAVPVGYSVVTTANSPTCPSGFSKIGSIPSSIPDGTVFYLCKKT